MHKNLLLRCVVVALLCVVALSVALMHMGQQTHAAPALTSSSLDVITSTVTMVASSTLAYWTAARMKAARSADHLIVQDAVPPAAQGLSGATPAILDPVHPIAGAGRTTTTSQTQAQARPVPSPHVFPYSTVGKIFFPAPHTNTDYVCS